MKGTFRYELAGKPLAGGHRWQLNSAVSCVSSKKSAHKHPINHPCRLAYLSFKADLKARMQCHNFGNRYYQRKLCCDRCLAIRPFTAAHHEMTYKNFKPCPPYARTVEDHNAYISSGRRLSFWTSVEGWQLETCSDDWMHLCYLGFARSTVPSALKTLQMLGFEYESGETNAQYLKRATVEMKATCKRHGRLESVCHRIVEVSKLKCRINVSNSIQLG